MFDKKLDEDRVICNHALNEGRSSEPVDGVRIRTLHKKIMKKR